MNEPKNTREVIRFSDFYRATIEARWFITATTLIIFALLELVAIKMSEYHKITNHLQIGTYPLIINNFSEVSTNPVSNINSLQLEVRRECETATIEGELASIKIFNNKAGATELSVITTNPTGVAERFNRCLSKIIETQNEKIIYYQKTAQELTGYKPEQSQPPETLTERKFYYTSKIAENKTTFSKILKSEIVKYLSIPHPIIAIFSIVFSLLVWILIFTTRPQLRWSKPSGDGAL